MILIGDLIVEKVEIVKDIVPPVVVALSETLLPLRSLVLIESTSIPPLVAPTTTPSVTTVGKDLVVAVGTDRAVLHLDECPEQTCTVLTHLLQLGAVLIRGHLRSVAEIPLPRRPDISSRNTGAKAVLTQTSLVHLLKGMLTSASLLPAMGAKRKHRDDRPRRPSPNTYVPRPRSRSRESFHRKPVRDRSFSRDSKRPHPDSPLRTLKTQGDRKPYEPVDSARRRRDTPDRESRVENTLPRHNNRRRSSSRDSRRRSPDFRRPRSPPPKRSSLTSRREQDNPRRSRSPRRRTPPPVALRPKYSREENDRERDKDSRSRRQASRSPAGERSRRPVLQNSGDKQRDRSPSVERRPQRDRSRGQPNRSSPPRRSTSPKSDRGRDQDKMSWRPYDNRGAPPPRGGWQQHDPRYSHSPPYNPGYHAGSPQPPAFSPQQSSYPPNAGQPSREYFNHQQGPPFNHHGAPPYHHGSPTQLPNGNYPPRGGFRGAVAPFNQRFAPVVQAQAAAGPHVRNLSWTPKTGTRGGHAPTVHGATQQAQAESATPTGDAPSIFSGTDNPFRPASKDLRVDDEAGKTGKSQFQAQSPADKNIELKQPKSPQIRFGLPKTSVVATPVAKPNAFVMKQNPLAAVKGSTPSNDRFGSRRETDLRREEAPRSKGLRSSLKQSDRYKPNRRLDENVHWSPLPSSLGAKDLHQKLFNLQSLMISHGHSLKELHSNALKPGSEPVGDDDPAGLADALANRATLEEEAYREHPDKRPHGAVPILDKGESLEEIFKKEVVAIKYKIRRPKKVLPEVHGTSNVYYRKPGNESVVGFGTYGKVFKAKHIYNGQDVALKRLRMEAEKDGFPITAMREMKILKHLEQRQAEGVIRLLEVMYEVNLVGSVGCFMAFEYMPHDLTGLLNHPTFTLNESQRKDLSFQMLDALGFMHKQGVLHRDIKAANILVSHHGQIKLADFGLARLYDMDRQLHYTNRVVTIWYRAPELLYGMTEYGPPIDVWAAACVIVEIFTKHAIFPGSGRELNQLLKIWEVMGFPTVEEWPGVSKTEWYFMMRPKEQFTNVFKEKYEHRTSDQLFKLLRAMLRYDPEKRPTCEDCLTHPFFTTEEPKPARVTELVDLGDWHELESKRARKLREADEKQKKDLENDLLMGPPSCGQVVKESRKDKDYKRDRLAKMEKRGANFSPIEPDAKKNRA